MYTKEFKEIVEKGVNEHFYIGTGNPNAKILFVGKEAGIDEFTDEDGIINYALNAKSWKKHIVDSTCETLNYIPSKDIPKERALRMAGHTWRKYQILHNNIYLKEKNKDSKIDFLENVFTTEMNDSPSKRTQPAQQKKDFEKKLKERRNNFFISDYIQNFPVIVLACSNYIKNDNNVRQIDDTFNVKYCKCEDTKGQPFWVHYNDDRSKLVIHTHQLSGAISNDLLKEMGKVIRKFMIDF